MCSATDTPPVILNLIALAKESIICASESWLTSSNEVTINKARRTFLPAKFFLLSVIRISSSCSRELHSACREVMRCLLAFSTFGILLCNEKHLRTASEVFSELLESTCRDLFLFILNSSIIQSDTVYDLLDWLFPEDFHPHHLNSIDSVGISYEAYGHGNRKRLLLLGRISLFRVLLSNSSIFTDSVLTIMIKKCSWLLIALVDHDVYASILSLQIPFLCDSIIVNWQPLFYLVLLALKSFLITIASTSAWMGFEDLLLQNLLNPHFLCFEIVIELWAFCLRYSELNTVKGVFDKLTNLAKSIASADSALTPGSPLRKIARVTCLLLANVNTCVVDLVYSSFMHGNKFHSSAIYVAFILEGFPLDLMSDNVRTVAKEKIITDYLSLTSRPESYDERNIVACGDRFDTSVFVLAASLQSHHVSLPAMDVSTLKFLIYVARALNLSARKQINYCRYLLIHMLQIVSHAKPLFGSSLMEAVILELGNLFISSPRAAETHILKCKPYLSVFLGALGDMEMPDMDGCPKVRATWELFHMLFRERHWALVHLAVAAFGCFAARTSCNQLWRFVPQDTVLSFDLVSGSEADEERFMLELKAFLEREAALVSVATSSLNELKFLAKEGLVLEEIAQKIDLHESKESNRGTKRRRLNDGVSKGVELLQNGLRIIGDGLSHDQCSHLESDERLRLLAQVSSLQDATVHLLALVGSG